MIKVVSKSTKKNLQKLQKDKQHKDKFDLEEKFLLDQVRFDDPKCLSYRRFDDHHRDRPK